MKRFFLLSVAVVMAGTLAMHTSCRKSRSHPTNPTPDDYRLLSYTKTTTRNILVPLTVFPLVTENYRFIYDGNRVSAIFFTSNDPVKVASGLAHLKAEFIRKADTIYKIFTDLNTSAVKERDTFLVNTSGQITYSYFPNEVHEFTYFGKLISREKVVYRDSGTAIAANLTYTSDQGDFLNRLWDGVLTASFPDSGIVPYMGSGPYLFHDSDLTLPLNITWGTVSPNLTPATVEHFGHASRTDQLSGYFMHGITVNAVDAQGTYVRTGHFPAGYSAKQFYEYYDEQANRPGDYMQLESFTTYGVNIYPNDHLIWQISSPYNTTRVVYDIDADSKVTFANVTTKDSVLKNVVNVQYKLQWETR